MQPHKQTKLFSRTDNIYFDMFKYLKKHNATIFKHIHILYSNILKFNYIPLTWKIGSTTLIPKNDPESINNWRPITLLNTLYKGFTLILNTHLQKILTNNNIIPNEQCGFNKNQDTSIAISAYIETIKKSKSTNIPLHVLYINFKAAFDSVQHWVIEKIFSHININNNIKQTIVNLMNLSYTSIKTIDGPTKNIELKTGIKQGDPLSLTIFLLYLLPIQWSLIKTQPKNINNFNHLWHDPHSPLKTNSKYINLPSDSILCFHRHAIKH